MGTEGGVCVRVRARVGGGGWQLVMEMGLLWF